MFKYPPVPPSPAPLVVLSLRSIIGRVDGFALNVTDASVEHVTKIFSPSGAVKQLSSYLTCLVFGKANGEMRKVIHTEVGDGCCTSHINREYDVRCPFLYHTIGRPSVRKRPNTMLKIQQHATFLLDFRAEGG